MDNKLETGPTIFDTAKLFLASGILIASIVGYYYFGDRSALLRAIGVLLALAAAVGVVYRTYQGQLFWKFVQGARIELRKVVWPTREEAIQMTAVVLVFSMIGGVFFWLLDLFLLWVTRQIMG